MTDPITTATRELDTRLTSHIPDDRWRASLADGFVRWLVDQGWRPPPERPEPRRRECASPTSEYRQRRAELEQHIAEVQARRKQQEASA